MPLDVLEADPVEIAHNGADGAPPRRVDAQGVPFDLMMQVLQRDDPLRRLYIQRRWHGYPTSVFFSLEAAGYNFERPSLSPIPLSRR
jgi:hypothetical protein